MTVDLPGELVSRSATSRFAYDVFVLHAAAAADEAFVNGYLLAELGLAPERVLRPPDLGAWEVRHRGDRARRTVEPRHDRGAVVRVHGRPLGRLWRAARGLCMPGHGLSRCTTAARAGRLRVHDARAVAREARCGPTAWVSFRPSTWGRWAARACGRSSSVPHATWASTCSPGWCRDRPNPFWISHRGAPQSLYRHPARRALRRHGTLRPRGRPRNRRTRMRSPFRSHPGRSGRGTISVLRAGPRSLCRSPSCETILSMRCSRSHTLSPVPPAATRCRARTIRRVAA